MTPHHLVVAVISPETMVTAGFTAMLGRHPAQVQVVGPDAATAPDVLLYDVLGLEDDGGAGLDRWIHHTATAVIAIGRDSRPDLLGRALADGVDGCIPLSIGETALLATLAATVTRSPSAAAPICACPSARPERLGAAVGLSAREAAILVSVAQGLSNGEIAEREFLSINTVKTYLRSAYGKIGAHSRSQAVLWVLTSGFDAGEDAGRSAGG